MCENANDVNTVEQDDMLEECNADDCMEKTIQNCADMTEEEHAEQKTFYDDLTGKALKNEKVIDARLDETKAWQDMGVREVVPVAECMKKSQKKPIRGLWVDVNKGAHHVKVHRSQMELKHQYGRAMRDELFAAMPPLDWMRLLQLYGRQQTTLQASAQAHVHRHLEGLSTRGCLERFNLCQAALRDEHARPTKPPELGKRSALRPSRGADFQRGTCNPCMYYHPSRDVRVLVHGDDFAVTGSESQLRYVTEVLQNKYKTKVMENPRARLP